MEEKKVEIGEYSVVVRLHDENNLLEVIVLDALGEEIEGMHISDDDGEEEKEK